MRRRVFWYGHTAGDCSITGGYAYRGRALPLASGTYVYGDLCSGRIWNLAASGGVWSARLLVDSTLTIVAFGEGLDGELYVAHYAYSGPGAIYRLVPGP
jgi:hypothetical protein